MARYQNNIAILFLCLSVFLSYAAAADYDSENPVDLYGADGLPFTPDDILITRGGYTNTAIMATAYGERKDGMDDSPEDDIFKLGLASWTYDDPNMTKGGSCVIHMLCTDKDPQSDTGGAKWRPLPPPLASSDYLNLFEPENFGYCEFEINTPEDQSSMFGGGKLEDQDDWWNGGNNLRISLLTLGNWEEDGTLSGGDPSVTVSTDHFPAVKDLIDKITVDVNHCRGSCISVLNMENGNSGVAGFCALTVKGLVVRVDGKVSGLDIEGDVKNTSPTIDVDAGLVTAHVTIKGNDSEPDPDIDWGILTGDIDVDVGAIWILDELRKELKPSMGVMDSKERERVVAEFNKTKGIDVMANEVIRAVVRTSQWLPWVPASDAGAMTRSSDDIDLSTTKLDDSRTSKAEDVVTGANGPMDVSNGGMDYLVSDTLIYGRDSVSSPRHNRLLEWFASNWLCLNMTDFQPYSADNGKDDKADAQWHYYDLICDKKITHPDNNVDSPIVMDDAWPPPSTWFGGHGMMLGAQAAISHLGDSTGPEKPQWNTDVEPGNPKKVLAAVVALTPFAGSDGAGTYATYNVLGVTLGDAEGWELQFTGDPEGDGWTVEWPPPNDWPESPTKFFHGCVANGHVDSVTPGRFATLWDFDGTHEDKHKFANVSYTPEGQSDFGRLLVMDPVTGRTGVHHINIFYEPADL